MPLIPHKDPAIPNPRTAPSEVTFRTNVEGTFAVLQADTPHEIFHAMDIPIITNQWWSAYISAKRLSEKYVGVLDELGFPSNRCSYCSLGLACTLAADPGTAPDWD